MIYSRGGRGKRLSMATGAHPNDLRLSKRTQLDPNRLALSKEKNPLGFTTVGRTACRQLGP